MCPQRSFQDEEECEWLAWDVIPAWGERRMGERRSAKGDTPPRGRERRRAERRVAKGIRIALTPALSQGWLAFEAGDARRRLAPIPEGWHELPDDELRALWRRAEQLPPRRRRLVE